MKNPFTQYPAALRVMALMLLTATGALGSPSEAGLPAAGSSPCPGDNGGLSLSPGFCATIFADNLGHARHLTVAPDGSVYVNTWSGFYYGNDTPPAGGFLLVLQDSKHTGVADVVKRFGDSAHEGSAGGTGVYLYRNYVYAEVNDRIVRYALTQGEAVPRGKPEVVVSGLPITGDHPMHPFIIDDKGNLFVDLGSATNACEEKNRAPGSKGNNPCVEKETRAGIWRYDADKLNQAFSAADRYATGLRNGEGFAIDGAGRLFVTQHGRDQLYQDWIKLYAPKDGPLLPAEEIVLLKQGADYGWPECYYDGAQKKLVLAPEYGGDGGKTVGLCKDRTPPVAAFPAHLAPNDLLIVSSPKFPAAYREGAFVAFHGSWNRAPAPQEGYAVVFQPMANGAASAPYVLFADGFAGPVREPGSAKLRPTGLAAGPAGELYIADDSHGRIWQVTYRGPAGAKVAAAPKTRVGLSADALPPEGIHADAGKMAAALRVPPGATQAQVNLGNRIYHGQVSNGTCAGCHGSDAHGSPIGADLTSGTWLWGDGSLESLTQTIAQGVQQPKKHLGAMPPMGGTPLSAADLKAVAAYVWALGHPQGK